MSEEQEASQEEGSGGRQEASQEERSGGRQEASLRGACSLDRCGGGACGLSPERLPAGFLLGGLPWACV